MKLYRRGNTWWMDGTINGLRIRESTGCEVKADAMVAAKARISGTKALPATRQGGSGLTISQAVDKASRTVWRSKELKSTSTYITQSKTLISLIGDLPLSEIDSTTIQTLESLMWEEEYSRAYINRILSLLSVLFSAAIDAWDMKLTKPRIKLTDERKYARRRLLTKAEEIRILQAAPQDVADLVVVLLDTGARISEVTGITYASLNLDDGDVRIFSNTKNDEPRAIPMSDRVREILVNKWKGVCPFNKDQAEHKWAAVRADIGGLDDVVLHTMRHTCATRLLEAGVDIRVVKEWMGHKTLETTLRYAKMTSVQLRGAAEAQARYNALRQAAALRNVI